MSDMSWYVCRNNGGGGCVPNLCLGRLVVYSNGLCLRSLSTHVCLDPYDRSKDLYFQHMYDRVRPTPKMQPRIWGPDVWRSIHYIALGYPVKDPSLSVTQSYISFFELLGSVLPCATCAQHYASNMIQVPVASAMANRASLFRWTVDLHNTVNASNGKQSWSYDQAYDMYASRREPDRTASDGTRRLAFQIASLIVSIALFGGLTMWLLRRKRHITR